MSRLARQLEEVRDQIARAASDEAKLAGELKRVEERLGQEQDPLRRKAIESELRLEKARMEDDREQRNVQQSQQRSREAELEARLRAEQAKLDELNERLNTLERTLDAASGSR